MTADRPLKLELKPGEQRPVSVQVKGGPRASEVAGVWLDLQGGLLSVRTLQPSAAPGPWWKLDLGKGAGLFYAVGGSGSGAYQIEVRSEEQEKPARLEASLATWGPGGDGIDKLLEAETALAVAETARRRLKSAPEPAAAIADYDRAIQLAAEAGAPSVARLALTQKARYFIFQQDRFVEAQALLMRAVGLPDDGDAAQQALAWKTLSSADADLGEYAEAVAAAQRATDLYRQTGDVYWQGIVLGNLSSAYAELGRSDEAISSAQEALADAEQEHDPAGVVFCLGQLADLYRQHGDLQGAYRAFREGLGWVDRIHYSPLVEAQIRKDLGLFYVQSGSWELAEAALVRCLKLESGHDDPTSLEARGLLGAVLLHQGRSKAAVAAFSSAINAAHALGLPREEGMLLVKRASAYLAVPGSAPGPRLAAEADIQAARLLADRIASEPLLLETDLALGDAHLQTSPADAAPDFRAALQLARKTAERGEEAMALAGLARVQQRAGELEDSLGSVESALHIVESSRGTLADSDLQASYFAMHRVWYELAVDVCMQLDRARPDGGYASRAFGFTERARARAMLDALSASGYRPSAVPTAVSERMARNEQTIRRQQHLVSQAAAFNQFSSTQESAARELDRLYREEDDLDAEMRASDGKLNTLLGGVAVDLTTVQRELLGSGGAMLAFWTGAAHSYRWTVTPAAVTVLELPGRGALEAQILPLEGMLQTRRPELVPGEDLAAWEAHTASYNRRLRSSLNKAGEMLLAGVPKDAGRILIVADGALASLPFPALRVGHASAAHYALEDHSFMGEPSASVAVYLKQHAEPRPQLRIAVFADPVFGRDDARLLTSRSAARTQAGALTSASTSPLAPIAANEAGLGGGASQRAMPRLINTGVEARAIFDLAPRGVVDMMVGLDANPAQVRGLPPKSVLHFATHTLMVANHPEMSGILLSMFDKDGRSQDGVLWQRDIYALHLSSSLVVLNGCETRRADEHSGDGLNSLAHAFFYAGARSVVGALWSVEDASARRMMEAFYRGLLGERLSADQALHDAQREMLNDARTSSPTEWAAFAIDGWPARDNALPDQSARATRAPDAPTASTGTRSTPPR